MSNLKTDQNAFTIIELLIASAVFTFVILGASVAIVQMGRLYYKGILTSKTQTATRALIESISRPIQYDGSDVVKISGPDNKLCVGTDRYTYQLNVQKTTANHVIVKDKISTPSNCGTSPPSSDQKDMLGNGMRITKLDVNQVPSIPKLYNVEVTVIYGEDDDIDLTASPEPVCKSDPSSSQWCSKVTYKTKVFVRR